MEDKTYHSVIKDIQYILDIDEPNVNSYYTIKCPFCGAYVDVQKWSFVSQGKRCDCGALLRSWEARKLSHEHYEAMLKVRDGADVYSLGTAVLLREVQSYDTCAIHITDLTAHVAFFNAELTQSGKRILKNALRKSRKKEG